MMRPARALLPLLLLPVLLTGCDADKSGGTAADSADLDAAAGDWGVAPELVYVTKVSGYTVFQESVGEYNDEFVAAYRSEKGATKFGLFVGHGTMTAESCPKQPLGEVSEKQVTCEHDGDAWYRKAGDSHEYAVPDDGVVIRLIADVDKVDRAVLRKAAEAAHRPDDAELAALLPTTNGADT
ncbi:hypothetical protein [Streptomyces hawaiiensis]|uniref:DUF3558 domain-containing protein n=1 Tax=Streptomyces hawaiiensis TaxID=67305 RepID=A0A6G5RKG7_9ACTN|nr:hypothetical protein [Streptomyces hawaiiensis]QCD58530.1 hypothetical protein CEB94_29550 [Streptomyces hawaiiensis]